MLVLVDSGKTVPVLLVLVDVDVDVRLPLPLLLLLLDVRDRGVSLFVYSSSVCPVSARARGCE